MAAEGDNISMALRDSVGNDMQGASVSAFMFDGAVISPAVCAREEVEEAPQGAGAETTW